MTGRRLEKLTSTENATADVSLSKFSRSAFKKELRGPRVCFEIL